MRYPLDWNDLRFFLAVARAGTLSGAARMLRVDAGTVSRRLSAMETALGARCFERRPEGYPLTEQGRNLLTHAERVEAEVISLDRAVDAGDSRIAGLVSVTVADSVATSFMLPMMRDLRNVHPDLRIDLAVDTRVLNLSRREVDVALRMARSQEGELLSRRVGRMDFGLYASAAYLDARGTPRDADELGGHDFIDFLGDYPKAPIVDWFRTLCGGKPPALRVNGVNERVRAAALGLGITPLPFIVADMTGLKRILPQLDAPPLKMWLLAHPEAARIPRVRTVMDFIAAAAGEHAHRFSGKT